MSERLLLRVEEVAETLSIGRSKTYELIAAGELPVVRLGRCVRVPAAAVRRWVEAQSPSEALVVDNESYPPARVGRHPPRGARG
jgi:excisionase family DNA binding protein